MQKKSEQHSPPPDKPGEKTRRYAPGHQPQVITDDIRRVQKSWSDRWSRK